jgi:hypothetical protein
MQSPDDKPQTREDLDAETIVEDAEELFGAEDRSPPVGESEIAPPG